MEGPACTGCNSTIEEGSVIAFGESLFHLKCFICAKCSEPVDCESNLLLLTNGKPVCESCSYCCNACKQVIRDEAIMTGDEAYHAECFQCVSCKKKIDDLVFTQTSKGIHCTPCHEKRRAEKQRRREERERRQQQKQTLNGTSKELPAAPPTNSNTVLNTAPPAKSRQPRPNAHLTSSSSNTTDNRSTSFNSQPNADYMQTQTSSQNSRDNRSRRPSAGPPTPSRSRSNSVDTPPTIRLPEAKLSPSRSEVVASSKISISSASSPSSPPLSVGSVSPHTPVNKNLFNSSTSTSTLTKSTSTTTLENNSSAIPEILSLNLSFFDNESSDLLNLTNKLGANISLDIYGNSDDKQKAGEVPVIVKTTENITRASQFLESSLMNEEELNGFPQPPEKRSSLEEDENQQLRTELEIANSKLNSMQASYIKIKDASRKALEEFTRAKEEFAKEVALRQQQEYTILQLTHQLNIAYRARHLTRPELSVITKEEIERVARIRVELDKTCNELKGYRNVLIMDIDSIARQKQVELDPMYHLTEQKKALLAEIASLKSDREQVKSETDTLEKMKDEVLHEMVMLNTKNAELTEMNNDLSRRVTEREREAAAVIAGTSFLYSPSPSLSTELHSPTNMQRKSSEASIARNIAQTALLHHQQQQQQQQPPKVFKLKKKGNMFAKLSGKSNKVDSAASAIYGNGVANNASSTLSLASPNNESYMDFRQKNNSSTASSASNNNKQSQENTQHGSHTFLPTSFLRPIKCDACGEKMWGLSELRCQGCLYATHARCLSHVPQLCYGGTTASSFDNTTPELDLPHRSLFGNDLSEQARYEGRNIPAIIEHSISAVEKRGMDYEGIYRKSGGAAQMRLIHQSYDSGDPVDLEDEDSVNDICAVTSVLKQYFRELPNPLLPYNLYSQFIEAVTVNVGQDKTDKFYELLSQLPKVNYDTLRMLMLHLYRVQQRHNENLMTTKNLAMVFGPTLLRDVEASRDLVDMSYKNAVVEFLIINAHDLLP